MPDAAMSVKEVRCQCGVMNRAPDYRIGRLPKCGLCGAPLPEPVGIRLTRFAYRSRFVTLALASVGIFVVLLVADPWKEKPPLPAAIRAPGPSAPTSEGPASAPLPPVKVPVTVNCSRIPEPRHGLYQSNSSLPSVAPFTVRNEPGANYLLKLQDAVTRETVVSFFVYGGRELHAEVPLGNFTLKYATGQRWCGGSELFGPDTDVSEALSVLRFYKDGSAIHGNIVELILQAGGNLETHRIARSEF